MKEVYWSDPEERIATNATIYDMVFISCMKESVLKDMMNSRDIYCQYKFPTIR
mgnify:CR=1 FL=1|jgi:hypothetical protein